MPRAQLFQRLLHLLVRGGATVWLLLAVSLSSDLAEAASLQISPVSVRFAGDSQAASIALQNMGEAPIYGQVRVYLWDQKDGEDVLTATRDVIASPPIVQIAPGASQAIRLVVGGATRRAAEGTYRVLIDELGRADGTTAQGVDIRLRYSVPVFLAPAPQMAGAAPRDDALDWVIFRHEGAWMLKVRNNGAIHAQLGSVEFSSSAGKHFDISKGLFGYVLAGREKLWKLPVDDKADLSGAVAIRAVINARAPTAFTSRPQ